LRVRNLSECEGASGDCAEYRSVGHMKGYNDIMLTSMLSECGEWSSGRVRMGQYVEFGACGVVCIC
jgi:hypothetical protein